MASLYTQPKSPYWWIKFRDPATGKIKRESTKLRWDNREQSNQAKVIRAERTVMEAKVSGVSEGELWQNWVVRWLSLRYSPKGDQTGNTLSLYMRWWERIEEFLIDRGVTCPRQLSYNDVMEYISTRIADGAQKNSAITEIAVLKVVMSEAVRRGFANRNPAHGLGIRSDPKKLKAEISEKEMALIRQALRDKPEWMSISWEIACHQGCRCAETKVRMRDVDVETRTIAFTIKGGHRHVTKLHPALVPLMVRLKQKGVEFTHDGPTRWMASIWRKFFNSIGLKHISFHCTRVTVITQLARSGVNEQTARRFVGHSSKLVHQIYTRLSHDDLGAAVDAIPSQYKSREP